MKKSFLLSGALLLSISAFTANAQQIPVSNLDFTSKKRILKKCLDRNMDYIPYADMDDSEYKIDEQTRILNDIFYKGGNDE